MSELRLQQQCFIWFHNSFPEHRGRLFHNFQNPKSAIQGAQLKGLGLLSGVADFTLIANPMIYIELKTDKGFQSEAQKKFEQTVVSFGHKYYVCRTLSDFQRIITENL